MRAHEFFEAVEGSKPTQFDDSRACSEFVSDFKSPFHLRRTRF